MQTYHQTSPHRIQAIRLFHLIQQFSPNPRLMLNAEALHSFMPKAGMVERTDVIKFLHDIDKEGREINQQYFGLCISKSEASCQLNCLDDLAPFHQHLRARLEGSSYRPLRRYEEWDDNRLKTQQAKDSTLAQILINWEEIKMFLRNMDSVSLASNIAKINRCFSHCTLFPQKVDEIYSIYEEVYRGNFLSVLEYSLTMDFADDLLIEVLKTLCYVYQSLRFERLRIHLQQSFLLRAETAMSLMRNMLSEKIPIRYYSCVMSTLIIHRLPAIRSEILLEGKDLFLRCCESISMMKEEEGLYFGMEFLKVMVEQFGKLEMSWQVQNASLVSNIFQFAMGRLPSCKEIETQAACLQLVAECIKIPVLPNEKMKELKVVNNVFSFDSSEALQPLFLGALEIVKAAICFDKKEAEQVLIGDKNFDNYAKTVLLSKQAWSPTLSILHILLMIASSSTHTKMLYEKELIEVLFGLAAASEQLTNNGCILLYASEIVTKLVQNSLNSEWKLTYLYEKGLLNGISNMLLGSCCNDEVLLGQYGQLFYAQSGLEDIRGIFTHKQVFINCQKALYLASCETTNASYQKKRELYVKQLNREYVRRLWEAYRHFFSAPKNTAFIHFNLKQEQTILRETGDVEVTLKMSKLMSRVVEEMTYCLRKRNTELDILKDVHFMRQQLNEFMYRNLPLQQLESNSIPIYIKLVVSVEGSEHPINTRCHRLSWAQFRSCLNESVRKRRNFEPGFYNIYNRIDQREIKSEQDYFKMVDWVLSNYANSNFEVSVALRNVQNKLIEEEKPMPDFGRRPYPGSIGYERNYASHRGPGFMSNRLPEERSRSPFSRRWSPHSAAQCKYCGNLTQNRSLICTNCANRG